MIPNKNLTDILLKNGKITSAIADSVLKEAGSLNRPVEDVINEKRIVSEEEIGQAKSEFFKVPLKTFKKDETVASEILNFIPEEVAKTHKLVAFARDKDTVLVGMLQPDDV
ncbi:MAG: hypothetical protein Q7U68_05120, partial [Candidatus Roizmanbacteria bacterium]|nr:hypothetical protein [Candidatus Roizmanbacteria bacterium]